MIDMKSMHNVKFIPISYDGKSPENNAWDEYVKSKKKPLQWIADKFTKNRCMKLIKAKWNVDVKSMKLTILVNADYSKDIDVPYDEICKEMKWRSFKIVDKSAVPNEMTPEEINELYAEAVKKTVSRDKKWFKEHPETDPSNKKRS